RWGRHWLDVARFGESVGKTRNFPLTFAWRYRDYVVDAFNNDMPYDQFVREQIAGDLLPANTDQDRKRQIVATGFLGIGSHDLNEGNTSQFEMDIVGEQIDTVSRSLVALTVGCARCHDHKFDPIPTADYYALAGIFQSTELLSGYVNKRQKPDYFSISKLHELPGYASPAEAIDAEQNSRTAKRQNNQLANLRKQLQEINKGTRDIRQNRDLTKQERDDQIAQLNQERKQIQRRIRRVSQQDRGRKPPTGELAIGVRDKQEIADCKINLRGDPGKLGGRVARGFLQVATTEHMQLPETSSGRVELANWLVDNKHPLTARVIVNRVWQHMFGEGIVRTVDNFGTMGERPTHPELLDYLANRFMQEGWSIKSLVRQIALSHTYQLSSEPSEKNAQIDGDNRYLWRMAPRRMDAESIRDAILQASGALQLNRPDASPVAELPIAESGRNRQVASNLALPVRSIYLPVVRNNIDEFFTVFDFPDPSEVRGKRDVTTVPTQALFMMNSDFVLEQAELAAKELIEQSNDDSERIVAAYRRMLSRTPTEDEISRTLQYVVDTIDTETRKARAESIAWTDVCQALFASAEFRYR
ncbi:MAG: DUF1553 domain-containing protein, partial [Planctomycetales bacterium]|nr:DUF1553 domain-containing protein [Planctomycetales bacterium]